MGTNGREVDASIFVVVLLWF